MSINWVMTNPAEPGFVKLPNERVFYTSPPRTSLQLSSSSTFPGSDPFSAKSDSGILYLTNQRIVYLPSAPTPELKSFSTPILNLQDSYVRAPFFGANYWVALCKPVAGGNIPPTHAAVELRFTFKDGGAFDFHTMFEQIKERLHQAYVVAQETSHRDAAGNIDLANVHLEQLPAYEAPREAPEDDGPTIISPVPVRPTRDSGIGEVRSSLTNSPKPDVPITPDEPPPGYEEAQAQAVTVDLDHRRRLEAERRDD
ncbi:uncharacterized protein L3040_004292 [Drepanopeziza brunnea f. sp. 'multigermtubi']|uniref:uncharacterized protein n=1 Tax=Drepanopeziza brunnea f. sp. 'multigermtubi' TaxID=698441 RepID=UPI0023A3F54E|nr:hypothetical protein L3040_004292 [Drepanopeziza brunnea f. sp. 'multigermtubi']